MWLGDRAGGSSRFWGSSPTPGGVHWVVVVYVDARKVRLGWGSCWCLGARLPSPLATTCHAVVNDLRLDVPPAPSLLLEPTDPSKQISIFDSISEDSSWVGGWVT